MLLLKIKKKTPSFARFWHPRILDKADFLYFEVKAPNGINLIMLRDSSVTFSAKNQKNIKVRFWVINLFKSVLMLQQGGPETIA